jgi:XTP/dITP diphosphohydrolase
MTHSPTLPSILLATANPHKVEEIVAMLAEAAIEAKVVSLLDFPHLEIPEESGATLEANAIIKAQAAASATGLIAVADDSGLEVAALGGQPGVQSKRFAGEFASDADRYNKLLEMMRDVPESERQARFRCCIAIVAPDSAPILINGICAGHIAFSPSGTHGFGYDPVFIPEGMQVTMAELPMAEKNRISHRFRALQAAIPVIKGVLAGLAQIAEDKPA